MAIVSNFCCCSLQRGGIVYGWLGLVGSVLHILSSFRILGGYTSEIADYPVLKYALEVSFATQFATGLVCLVAFILLVYGSKTGNRYLLLPWLTMGFGAIISLSIVTFVIAPIFLTEPRTSAMGGALFGLGLIGLVLQVYIFLCVLSLFQDLREKDLHKDIPLPTVVHHVVTHTFAPGAISTNTYCVTPVTHTYPPAATPYPDPFPTAYDPSVVSENYSKV